MAIPIENCELSIRTTNVLKTAGIETVEQLQAWSMQDLRKLKNCGTRTLDEIRDLRTQMAARDISVPRELLDWVIANEGLIWQLAYGKAVIVPLHRLVSLRVPNGEQDHD
jgi:hypothetical protein